MLGTGTWFLLTNVLCNLFFNYTRCKDVFVTKDVDGLLKSYPAFF